MNKIIIAIVVILVLVGGYMYQDKNEVADEATEDVAGEVQGSVKEFTMNSWMENKDGAMKAFFSLNEIRVKQGDTVKITVTNTAGIHDFVLDEFGIKKDTPVNEPVVIEFVADKKGTFEYYCSKYNHRALGQKGSLIVE